MDGFSDRGSIPLGSTIAYRAEHQITQIVVFRNVFVITLYTDQD